MHWVLHPGMVSRLLDDATRLAESQIKCAPPLSSLISRRESSRRHSCFLTPGCLNAPVGDLKHRPRAGCGPCWAPDVHARCLFCIIRETVYLLHPVWR